MVGVSGKLPTGFDSWSDDARQAYIELSARAESAENALDRIRDMVITAQPVQGSIRENDTTLNWQTMIVTEVQRLSQQAINSIDPTHILYEITELLAQIMQGTSAYIASWNPDMGGILVLADYYTAEANQQERSSDVGAIIPSSDYFEQRLLTHGYWITHHDTPEFSPVERIQFSLYNIKTTIYVPMMTADGKLIGHMEVWDTQQKREFSQRQIEFMLILARQFTGAVRNVGLLRGLQQSEQRYSMLMRTMNEGLVQTNSRGIIQYANERFATLIGQAPDALRGIALEWLWVENSPPIPHAGEALHEVSFRRPDGTMIWTQVSSASMTDIRGEVIGTVYVFTDITQRRIAEQRSIELALENARVRILAEFIRDASHEFYTPLSVIRTRVYLLGRMMEDQQLLQHLIPIQTQTEAMLRLISDLVTMTTLDSTTEIRLQQTNLNELVSYAITSLDAKIRENGIRIRQRLSDEALSLSVDADKLLRAIYAILENAIHHTPADGTITIRSGIVDKRGFIEVEDSGAGIDPEITELIFQRFYRKDSAHSTRGFGLGLSIARKAVELHGGTIDVENQSGGGAIFRIWVPIRASGEH